MDVLDFVIPGHQMVKTVNDVMIERASDLVLAG